MVKDARVKLTSQNDLHKMDARRKTKKTEREKEREGGSSKN